MERPDEKINYWRMSSAFEPLMQWIDYLEADNAKLKDEAKYVIREVRADEWQEGEEWWYDEEEAWNPHMPAISSSFVILVRKRRTPSVRKQLKADAERKIAEADLDFPWDAVNHAVECTLDAVLGSEHFDVSPKEEKG